MAAFTTVNFSLRLTSPCAIMPFIETSVSNVFAGKAPPSILVDGIVLSAKFAVSVPETEASPETCNPAFA